MPRPAVAAVGVMVVFGFESGSGVDVIARVITEQVRADTGM
jgi:tripartite-type tricarboxylate transporter receptor subunit TctC